MALSVGRLWNIEIVGQLMNRKNLEGCGCGVIKVLYWHLPEGQKKTKKKLQLGVTGVLAKIQTKHLFG